MKIAIGSDHGGYKIKQKVATFLINNGYEIIDCGCDKQESCNYPIFGIAVGELVASKKADLGIVVCTSGVGISIAANKVKGIRCGLAWKKEIAHLIRAHNDANVLALPGGEIEENEAYEIINEFLKTSFEGGRHIARVDIINKYDMERK